MKTFVRIIILCFASFWLTGTAVAASKGKKAFEAGDYGKAYKLLSKEVKKVKGDSEKAEYYVMIGAAAAKKGKSSAKSKFKKALKLDPNVALPGSVEDDKKVRKAFAKAQKSVGMSTASSSGGGGSSDSIRSSKSAAAVDKSGGNLKNYLPFGVNNFLQGKTVTGAVTGAGQVLGLLLFLNRRQAAADADKDAKEVIADAEATESTEDPDFLQFIDDNEAFVNKARSEANLALGLFFASYGLSVIDALFDPFGTAKSASLDPREANKAMMADNGKWKFDLNLMPSSQPFVYLDMKKTF